MGPQRYQNICKHSYDLGMWRSSLKWNPKAMRVWALGQKDTGSSLSSAVHGIASSEGSSLAKPLFAHL